MSKCDFGAPPYMYLYLFYIFEPFNTILKKETLKKTVSFFS